MADLATLAEVRKQTDTPRANPHWVWRYGLVVLIFAVIIGLALLNRDYNVKLNLTIPIVLAVVAVAWYGGRGPGLLLGVLFEATTIIYTPIPPDSTIAKAWFGYFSTFALYVFLVLLISGLKSIQHRVQAQRDLLQVTLASIGDAVIATDRGGRITFMNPVAQQLTGWAEAEAMGTPLGQVLNIVDEENEKQIADPVEHVLTAGDVVGPMNHTILISRDGTRVPIDNTAAPISHDGQIKGVVLVFADATQRKLAEQSRRESEIMHRLVDAQEAERHRIARDLHDHLGQRMTALRLRIEGLTEKAIDVPALGKAIGEVQESAFHIDRDIGFLSWELRPTELEDLGLVDALGTFVREWSAQYHIDAGFHANIVTSLGDGRLSKKTETNLYRIVQEALHNILKHSRATKVSVLLHQRADDLIMIVEDNGRGFNSVVPPATSSTAGLGIIGMSERAALMGGTLEIDSQPGGGTTVLTRIPLDQPGTAADRSDHFEPAPVNLTGT